MTDDFDTRLIAMQAHRSPKSEQDAAIAAYERLRTARAIARSLLVAPTNSDVLAIFATLSKASVDIS